MASMELIDSATGQLRTATTSDFAGGGGGGGGTNDRELVVSTYRCKTAFTGASVGDTITATQIIDVTNNTPTTVATIWRNQTTSADFATAPSSANLELVGTTGLTDAQLRAQAVVTSPNVTRGAGNIDSNTQRVTLANDGQVATSIGITTDTEAAADGTGNYGIIAGIKRSLLNWTTLLTRIPAVITPGLFPVDTLGTPGVSRVQATGAASVNITLTTTCRRISMFATQGTWYSLTGAATANSHYIGSNERLDFDVPANTVISVLRETSDGSIRITELT